MTSGRLILIKAETLRITNLFQHCLSLSVDNLYEPCIPVIHDGFISFDYGKFVTTSVKDPNDFRYLNWDSRIADISNIIDGGNNLVFGNYNLTVLESIKKSIDCTIISYHYDSSLYNVMLEIFARTHLFMQDHNEVPITEHDKEVRASTTDLVAYYMQAFDNQKLVPKAIHPVGDYSVPVRDYFNFDKFFGHFKILNVQPSDAAKNYYSQWYRVWEPIWRKYNEN